MPRKKSLIEQLNENRKIKEPSRRGLVAVMAHKQEISDAIAKGYTMREIHTAMKNNGEMPIEYSSFTKLVNTYLKIKNLKKENSKSKSHIFDPNNYREDEII